MKKDSVIIFDFDGTIADTIDYIKDILGELSEELGFRKIKEEHFEGLRGKEAKEAFKEMGISLIKIPRMLKRVRSLIQERIEKIKPVDGMEKVLRQLKEENYTLGILTSSPRKTVEDFLRINNLNLFNFIYSEGNIFKKRKVMKSLIKEEKLNPGLALYVGDETGDIETARKAGIRAVAVTWGFNNEKILREWKPDFLARTPGELVEILSNFC